MRTILIVAYISLLITFYSYGTWIYVWVNFDYLGYTYKIEKFKQVNLLLRYTSMGVFTLILICLSTVSLICFVKLYNNSIAIFDKIINLFFVVINGFLLILSLWQLL